MEDPKITQPTSCDVVQGGLLVTYTAGTSKLIPHRHGPLPWPKPAELKRNKLKKGFRSSAAGLISPIDRCHRYPMEVQQGIRVISAERLNGDVLILFSDSKCALYSAELLRQLLHQAEEIPFEPHSD